MAASQGTSLDLHDTALMCSGLFQVTATGLDLILLVLFSALSDRIFSGLFSPALFFRKSKVVSMVILVHLSGCAPLTPYRDPVVSHAATSVRCYFS